LLPNIWGARYADALWRVVGTDTWNIARMVSYTGFLQPFAGFVDGHTIVDVVDGVDVLSDPFPCLDFVTLFVDDVIPEGFPTENGVEMECIIRYRGPASDDFPYYVEGPLGEVLMGVYSGKYSLLATDEITGLIYDPALLDASADDFIPRIQYDADAFDALVEHVMLRQTSVVDDVRAWAEDALYAPSGWIPCLDNEMRISPISRNRPANISAANTLNDTNCEPAPNWNQGQRTISQITYTYPRWFIPAANSGIEVSEYDGLAKRDITMEFKDVESGLRYGEQPQEYDASAFGAIGDDEGENISGVNEQASLLAQAANFDVLQRFRSGVQSIAVNVLRSLIPGIRVGSWIPWSLSWLPDVTSGLRGSESSGAQVVSIKDNDCVWRTLVLEESSSTGSIAGAPGFVSSLKVAGDDPSSGISGSLIVVSDVESA
jgi:hypothetical protein